MWYALQVLGSLASAAGQEGTEGTPFWLAVFYIVLAGVGFTWLFTRAIPKLFAALDGKSEITVDTLESAQRFRPGDVLRTHRGDKFRVVSVGKTLLTVRRMR